MKDCEDKQEHPKLQPTTVFCGVLEYQGSLEHLTSNILVWKLAGVPHLKSMPILNPTEGLGSGV